MTKSVKFGVTLLIVACLAWLSLLLVPFIPVSGAAKTGLVVALVALGEVLFWLGAVLAGKEYVRKLFNFRGGRKAKRTLVKQSEKET